MQMGNANINPWTEAKVNTKYPDRGPLLIIEGEKDHTVPWAIANAASAAEAQPRGDGDREDAGPRPRAHPRPRLAAGRADRTRFRQAFRPGQGELGTDDLGPSPAHRSTSQRLKELRPALEAVRPAARSARHHRWPSASDRLVLVGSTVDLGRPPCDCRRHCGDERTSARNR